MEKYKYIKNIILAILALLLVITNNGNSQVTYQKYDATTRGVEYNIVKSQIESNKKQMELLDLQKKSLSLTQDSITRSRIQGVISAKTTENFRLNQKAFTLMDANKVENIQRYNSSYEKFRPKQKSY